MVKFNWYDFFDIKCRLKLRSHVVSWRFRAAGRLALISCCKEIRVQECEMFRLMVGLVRSRPIEARPRRR